MDTWRHGKTLEAYAREQVPDPEDITRLRRRLENRPKVRRGGGVPWFLLVPAAGAAFSVVAWVGLLRLENVGPGMDGASEPTPVPFSVMQAGATVPEASSADENAGKPETRVASDTNDSQCAGKPMAPSASASAALLVLPLESIAKHRTLRLPSGIEATFRGRGTLRGTGSAVEIDWDRGDITLDVPPNRGITLEFRTKDATGRVLGTRFAITHNVIGTHLQVRRGRVEITCAGEEPVIVPAGATRTCFSGAGAALRWATARWADGGPPEEILDAVSRASRIATDGSPVAGRLLLLEMEAHLSIGDTAKALEAADKYLRDGYAPDRTMVLDFASRIAHESGGCPRALPYLDLLCEDVAGAPLSAVTTWAMCVEQEDPEHARSLFQATLNRPGVPRDVVRVLEPYLDDHAGMEGPEASRGPAAGPRPP